MHVGCNSLPSPPQPCHLLLLKFTPKKLSKFKMTDGSSSSLPLESIASVKGDQRRKDCYLIAACRTVTVARCVGSLLSVCICHPVYLCWPARGIACQTDWLCVQAWLSCCIWHCCCKHWLPGLFSVTCTLYIIIHMDTKVWCSNHFIHVGKSNQFKDIVYSNVNMQCCGTDRITSSHFISLTSFQAAICYPFWGHTIGHI